jgi:prepilin-type N-terminal cleavage/methylation domain-containing protein
MNSQKPKAFTLVELIVSITILAILWTIAFISMQWYSKSSRDSVRISDLSSIKTTFELFHIDAWKYPIPTDWYNVTYSWWLVWSQWIFWESTFTNISKLNKIPKDPLTGKEYTYSLLNTKQEYELAWIMESDSLAFNNTLLNQTNAADATMVAMVTWNYNWKTLNVQKVWQACIVAMPSIITSTWTTLEQIIPNNYLVYNNYRNLPSNYWQLTKFKLLGEPNLKLVNQSNMDLYCWDYSQLNTNEATRLSFVDNLQKAYSWTQVEVTWMIKNVLELTIDINNPSTALKIYTIDIVEQITWNPISNDQKLLAWQCNPTYHDETWVCISDTREVTITNWTWTQTWNWSSWNAVILQSCNPTFHTEDNVNCIANIWTCTIINGTWLNTWNVTSWSWDCTVLTCDTDFYNPLNNMYKLGTLCRKFS